MTVNTNKPKLKKGDRVNISHRVDTMYTSSVCRIIEKNGVLGVEYLTNTKGFYPDITEDIYEFRDLKTVIELGGTKV